MEPEHGYVDFDYRQTLLARLFDSLNLQDFVGCDKRTRMETLLNLPGAVQLQPDECPFAGCSALVALEEVCRPPRGKRLKQQAELLFLQVSALSELARVCVCVCVCARASVCTSVDHTSLCVFVIMCERVSLALCSAVHAPR